MLYRHGLSVLGCLVLLWAMCGCSSDKNSPEDAKLKNNVYTNRFFRFQLRIPNSWTIVNKPTARDVRNGAEMLLPGRKGLAASAAAAAKTNHYLLIARNVDQGTFVGILAHPVGDASEIETGKDLLDGMLEVATGPGKPLQQVNEVTPVKLASREFHRVDVTSDVLGPMQHQAMFVTIEQGYALMIMVSARSEAAVNEVVTKVGLTSNLKDIAGAKRVMARELDWFKQIKLQGISGTGNRRLAIINGKTFAAGDAIPVKAGVKIVTVRCVEIGETTALVTFEGVDGKSELKLGVY